MGRSRQQNAAVYKLFDFLKENLSAKNLCIIQPDVTAFRSFSHEQNGQERLQAEQTLQVFGQSTEYVAHCKVRNITMPEFIDT